MWISKVSFFLSCFFIPSFFRQASSSVSRNFCLISIQIMQGTFTLLLSATVSTVETVKNAQLLHNPSALTSDWPYTRRELSCRISPSRPGSWSLFLCFDIKTTVSTVLSLFQQSSCISLSPKYTGKRNFMSRSSRMADS